MVVGGLWCALWGTRWRLLGLVPIVLGLILAPTGRRPDVLIGRGGGHRRGAHRGGRSCRRWRAAARTSSWRAGSSTTATAGRSPRWRRRQAFRCDGHGCTARVKGMLLAVANSPAALRDDCAAAAILVLKFRDRRAAPRRGLSSIATRSPPAAPTPSTSMADASASRPWPTPAATAPGRQGSEAPMTIRPQPAMTTGPRVDAGRGEDQNRRISPTSRPWMSTWSGPKMRVS